MTGVWRVSALLLDAHWFWAREIQVHPDVAEVALGLVVLSGDALHATWL